MKSKSAVWAALATCKRLCEEIRKEQKETFLSETGKCKELHDQRLFLSSQESVLKWVLRD